MGHCRNCEEFVERLPGFDERHLGYFQRELLAEANSEE